MALSAICGSTRFYLVHTNNQVRINFTPQIPNSAHVTAQQRYVQSHGRHGKRQTHDRDTDKIRYHKTLIRYCTSQKKTPDKKTKHKSHKNKCCIKRRSLQHYARDNPDELCTVARLPHIAQITHDAFGSSLLSLTAGRTLATRCQKRELPIARLQVREKEAANRSTR